MSSLKASKGTSILSNLLIIFVINIGGVIHVFAADASNDCDQTQEQCREKCQYNTVKPALKGSCLRQCNNRAFVCKKGGDSSGDGSSAEGLSNEGSSENAQCLKDCSDTLSQCQDNCDFNTETPAIKGKCQRECNNRKFICARNC